MGVESKKYPFSVDTWTEMAMRKPFHFLTHAHKDHTVGIDSHGTHPIYCTSLTEKLVLRRYPTLHPSLFKNLEIGEPKMLAGEDQAFTVTAFDANHCPGAIMLLFEGSFGTLLHTGDCRLTIECLNQLPRQFISGSGRALDCVYLDCTFGNVTMVMPSIEEAIEQVKRCIWNHSSEARVYLACDMLGQETLLEAVANSFGQKIFINKDGLSRYLADLEVVASDFWTSDSESTRFEICEGFPKLYKRAMDAIKQAKNDGSAQPLFIRPSAQWYSYEQRLERDGSGVISGPPSFRFGGSRRRSVTSSSTQAVRDGYGVWHVCYSVHSSRGELERALKLLNPKEVISTTPRAGVCDFLTHLRDPLPSSMPEEAFILKAVDYPVSEDRELKRATTDHCSIPSKVINNNAVESPKRSTPLFGSAQYVLPSSPPSPLSFPCVDVSSSAAALTVIPHTPPVLVLSPFPSENPVTSSQVSNSPVCCQDLSRNPRSKRLFVELESDMKTSSLSAEAVPRPSKRNCHIPDPILSEPPPGLSLPAITPSSSPRESMPKVSVSHSNTSLEVRSKSLTRVPSRRKYRIPNPMPSLVDMINHE